MKSEIIVMLTHQDQTVPDALEVFETTKDLPVQYWGFKDVGLEQPEMVELLDAMKQAGKTTFLEVVSYSEEDCMKGAKLAVELGYDYLMGTVYHKSVFDYLKTQNIKFFPFCGTVYGSPSVLEGTIDEIISDGQRLLDMGVDGIDILAFRHKEGAKLAEAFCKEVDGRVVIAGSIDSEERIAFVNQINPWGFTMGSALFNSNFAPDESFRKNLEVVIDCMDSLD